MTTDDGVMDGGTPTDAWTPGGAVVIVSGGMDSVTLAHVVAEQGYAPLHFLSFDYGQRHKKELAYAQAAAKRLGATYRRVSLAALRPLLHGSALTDDSVEVPEGHYAAPNMAATVVPNRNAIMLSIAYGLAVAEGATIVAAGFHAGDHPIYPDCRPEFAVAFNQMERLATDGYAHPHLRLFTPFIHVSKTEIAATGARLGVPFAKTWSCYKGGAIHCGRCGTCVERREAMQLAGVKDPTRYETTGALPADPVGMAD